MNITLGTKTKKVLIALCLCSLGLSGCGYNPTSEIPPVNHTRSFEECVNMLKTPAHTAKWLEDFGLYDLDYNTGWHYGDKDLCYSLAESLWTEYHNGTSRGCCGQFAAFYVLCARTHGYSCGIILTWTVICGHARGWIQEQDGSVSMTDNKDYLYKRFTSIEKMKEYYKSNKSYTHVVFLNNKFK